jgi:hypothetical protein
VSLLHSQRQYTEAVPLAERYVALARQLHGKEAVEFATAIGWLGQIYRAQNRYDELLIRFRVSARYSENGCPFGRSCSEVHGACDVRINLYPAAVTGVPVCWTNSAKVIASRPAVMAGRNSPGSARQPDRWDRKVTNGWNARPRRSRARLSFRSRARSLLGVRESARSMIEIATTRANMNQKRS